MPVDRAAVERMFAPGGAIFRTIERVAAEVHTAVSVANPVDTGRSRSGWRTRFRASGVRIEFEVYNNVEYVAFIRRRGTNEERGAFICAAATRVFRAEGIRFTCRL